MALRRADGADVDLAHDGNRLKALFMAVWLGKADSDRLNTLTLVAGLGWREIAMLRALSRYLGQIGLAHGHAYVAEALVRNPGVANLLIALFTTRFDPAFSGDRKARLVSLRKEIEAAFRMCQSSMTITSCVSLPTSSRRQRGRRSSRSAMTANLIR